MFDALKAKKLYNQMLVNLNERKSINEKSETYDGFDRGYVLVPDYYANSKLAGYLAKLSQIDGYNFKQTPVQVSSNGKYLVIFSIDNEPIREAEIIDFDEYKARR